MPVTKTHMYDLNLVITVPTDVLAPCGAWSSAASVLAIKWDVKISLDIKDFKWRFWVSDDILSDLPMRSRKISDTPVLNKIKNQLHGTLPISMQVLPHHQTNPCYTVQKQPMPYCFPWECLPIRLTKGKETTHKESSHQNINSYSYQILKHGIIT